MESLSMNLAEIQGKICAFYYLYIFNYLYINIEIVHIHTKGNTPVRPDNCGSVNGGLFKYFCASSGEMSISKTLETGLGAAADNATCDLTKDNYSVTP